MKIRCEDCGKKFEVDTDEKGIPVRNKCDKCRARELERIAISQNAGVGKKKRSWWKR